MAVNLNSLNPEFKNVVTKAISLCSNKGIEMRPYCTIRDPFDQARLWRQSRTKEEILNKIDYLNNAGAGFIAYCLESVGPQNGRHATNAVPGFSWHQWGEAVDCVWVVENKSIWSFNKKISGINGYRVYSEVSASLGLTAGGLWKKLKDWPHVQLRSQASPGMIMDILEIDSEMKRRFDTALPG